MNPYRIVQTANTARTLCRGRRGRRAGWMVRLSLLLVILLEVLPTEAATSSLNGPSSRPASLPAAKSAFLAAIVLPLLAYATLNGWRALRACPVQVVIILGIVGLHLTWNAFAVMRMIRAG